MLIAKIIKSNSHIDYAARVLDSLETDAAPGPGDYGFGQFVGIGLGEGRAVGVIYNSQLINPEYGNYGPRLSTPSELNNVFSPDYLNEQGVLIGILLLGRLDASGAARQGVPREVLPINSEVETMDDEQIRAFHHDPDGSLQVHYYPHVAAHAGAFGFQLMGSIVDQLDGLAAERDRARLDVFRKTLSWQQTIGRMK